MTKFKVIVARTQFLVREVEADSKDEAIEKAWELDPFEWPYQYLSDDCEQHDAVESGSEYDYWEDYHDQK